MTSRARVKRTAARSKRRGGGFNWQSLFANPVTPVLIGLVIVLGVGTWVLRDANPAATDPTEETGKGDTTKDSTSKGNTNESGGTNTTKQPTTNEPTGGSKGSDTTGSQTDTATPPSKPADSSAEKPADTSAVDPAIQAARAKIDRSGGAAETMMATLYFSDGLKNGMSLQPVEVKLERTVGRLRETVEQLLNPPQDLKLYNSVPAGTKIGKAAVNFDKATGVATVDLTAEAATIKGSAAVNEMLASFVYSLTEIPDVKSVQLWVEGKPAVLDGYEWSKPLSRSDLDSRTGFAVEPVIKYSGN